MDLKKHLSYNNIVAYLLILMSIAVVLLIQIEHFKPFVNIKNALFIVSVSILVVFSSFFFLFKGKLSINKSIINIFVLVYLVWNILSYFIFDYTSKLYLILTICYVLLFFLVQLFYTEKTKKYFVYSICLTSILMGVYGIMQFLGKDIPFFINYFGSRFQIGTRVFTTLGNPNLQGGLSVLFLPILIALVIYSFRRKNLFLRIFSIIGFIGNFLLLLMAQTRGSWIAGFLTIITFAIFFYWKKELKFLKKHWLKSLFIVLLFLIIGVTAFNFLPDSIINPQTVNIRMFYYTNTLDMITETPSTLLLGRGLGSFSAYYPEFRDKRKAFSLGEKSLEFRVEHPHNEHLEILSDLGLIGYIVFVLIVISSLWLLIKKNDVLSIGLAAAIVGILIDGLMMQNLRFVVIAFLLWFSIGLSSIKTGLNSEKIETEAKNKSEKFNSKNKIKLLGFIDSKFIDINLNGIIIIALLVLIIFSGVFVKYGIDHYQQGKFTKLGLAYYTQGNNDNAVYYLQKSYDLDNTDKRTLYYLAPSYKNIGKEEKAIRYYKELLGLDYNFIQANSNLGLIYYLKGDFNNAKSYFLKQIISNNMFWRPYYMLTLMLSKENNLEKAYEYANEIVILDDLVDIPDEVLILSLKIAGQYYISKQDNQKVLDIYTKLYDVLPEGEEKNQIGKVLNKR